MSIEKPLSVSATGGTSGRALLRLSVVTAIAFSLPERMFGAAVARLSKLKSTWPDSSASCAGLPPLYGMCTAKMPASFLNSSPARWPALPLPPLA
ncbi:hypothetical protein D3C72_1166370 [compost metagenome]